MIERSFGESKQIKMSPLLLQTKRNNQALNEMRISSYAGIFMHIITYKYRRKK